MKSKTPYSNLSALIIEDSGFTRRIVVEMLRSIGINRIEEADDVSTALETCAKFVPEIVVVDWHMPGMPGSEFIRVAKSSPAIPLHDAGFIVITGQPTRAMLTELQVYGVDCVIRKPFSPAELHRKVDFVLKKASERNGKPSLPGLGRG